MTTRATQTKTRKRRKDAGVPKELTEAHKHKMQEARERKKQEREKTETVNLKGTIERLREQVVKAQRENDRTYTKLQKSKGDKNYDAWYRTDTTLLNTIIALRAHEQRLVAKE